MNDTAAYLRFPALHGETLTFVCDDDLRQASAATALQQVADAAAVPPVFDPRPNRARPAWPAR